VTAAATAAADGEADDGQRRRTSGSSSHSSSAVSPVFLEVPAQADLPAGPPPPVLRRAASVGRAASFSAVEGRQQRAHLPCGPSLSVPPASTPDPAGPGPPPASPRRPRSFRVNEKRGSSSVQHRAVRRAVSCRAATRRPRKSSTTATVSVGRASSLNEGARGRRQVAAAAEMASSIGSLGLFGSDFLFCSQTQLSSTADIYRRMQMRARINAALSNDSSMSPRLLLSFYDIVFIEAVEAYQHSSGSIITVRFSRRTSAKPYPNSAHSK